MLFQQWTAHTTPKIPPVKTRKIPVVKWDFSFLFLFSAIWTEPQISDPLDFFMLIAYLIIMMF